MEEAQAAAEAVSEGVEVVGDAASEAMEAAAPVLDGAADTAGLVAEESANEAMTAAESVAEGAKGCLPTMRPPKPPEQIVEAGKAVAATSGDLCEKAAVSASFAKQAIAENASLVGGAALEAASAAATAIENSGMIADAADAAEQGLEQAVAAASAVGGAVVKGAGKVAEKVTWALILEKIEIVRDFYQIIALFITKTLPVEFHEAFAWLPQLSSVFAIEFDFAFGISTQQWYLILSIVGLVILLLSMYLLKSNANSLKSTQRKSRQGEEFLDFKDKVRCHAKCPRFPVLGASQPSPSSV